jgi:hypothetical protein
MKWMLAALAAALIAACAVFTVVTARLSGEIGALRQQQAGQAGRVRSVLASQAARLTGLHRDLITCGDLQGLGLQSYWQDSSYNLQSIPVPLPPHCINR